MIRRILIIAGALVALGLGGIAVFIATLDVEAWRPRLVAEAERALGRPVTLGSLGLGLGLAPTVKVRDLAIANLPGGTRPEMARIARGELQLALIPLLSGELHIRRVLLDEADVLLEVVDGRPNWLLGAPREPAAEAAPRAAGGGRSLRVDEVLLTNARLAFPGGPPGGVTLTRLDAQADRDMTAEGELRWENLTIRYRAQGSPLARILADARGPQPVSLLLEADGARLALRGTLTDPGPALGYDIEVTGEATPAAAARLAALGGIALPAAPAVQLAAHIAGTGTALPQPRRLDLTLIEADRRLALRQPGADAPLAIEAAGFGATLSGTLGALGPALSGGALPVNVAAEYNGHRAVLTGSVARPLAGQGVALDLVLSGPGLDTLRGRLSERGAFFAEGAALAGFGPEGRPPGELELRLGAVPTLNGRLSLGRLDLDLLRPSSPAAPAPPAPRDGRLIPATPLEFSALRGFAADLAFGVAALRSQGTDYRDIAGQLTLREGVARIEQGAVTLPAGRVTYSATADASRTPPALRLAARAERLDIAALGPALPISGLGEFDLDLAGQGATLRAWAAGANGHIGLSSTGGHVAGGLVQGALPPAIGALAPRIAIACIALRLDVAAGIGTTRALLADTSQGRVGGGGTISLRDESLNLRLATDVAVPLLGAVGVRIRAPVPVGGTLSAPRFDTAAMVAGGAAGTVLGQVERFVPVPGVGNAAISDCGTALRVARGGRAGPVPQSQAPAEQRPPVVQELLRPGADALRGIFGR